MKRQVAEVINLLFGFRKFILILILYVIGITFRCMGLINGAEMVSLFTSTTIAFFGANGVEHIVSVIKSKNSAPVAPTQVADTNEKNDNDEVEPVIEEG